MKVAVNGLIIDERKAGIGHYGYNLINALIKKGGIEYTLFLQKSVKVNYESIYYSKEYGRSYKRIIDEQLFLPFKYKKYELVHFIDYSSPLLNISAPFIITLHDLSFYKYPETFSYGSRKMKELLTPLGVKSAARIITDSENTKRDIIEYFPFTQDKVRVVYPGAPDFKKIEDKNEIENVTRKYGIFGDYILSVGTFEPRKNLPRLIDAYKIIRGKHKDLRLVLIGKKGWLYDDIMSKIESVDIADNIIYTGYVKQEDMSYLYSGARVFAYPSLYEGFGFPPLEAMKCGTPVVVSNISSLPEVVGDCGVYVDPLSVEGIAEGIEKVLGNDNLRERFIKKGLERTKIFSWDNAADEITQVYKEILE